MIGARRRPIKTPENDAVLSVPDSSASPPPTEIELARKNLRQRWELACVLNFLHVYEAVIGSDLKMSAEEIETAIIESNAALAQLHLAILKGITSKKKTPNVPDAWTITLIKTLAPWWRWFGEGNFPLSESKGMEISMYKELDPTTRLLLLKSLCELRADEYDAVDFVNNAVKSGTEVSAFQKVKLAGDGDRISFWYDGNETIGYRLYKEVLLFQKEHVKGKGTTSIVNSQWETIATNLDEFNKVVTEFSSSDVKWKVALSKSIEDDIIPVLQKHSKKKQKVLLRQKREQMLLDGFRNSGITRSCRNQKPIDYRYGDYDKAISQAIHYTNKRKRTEELKRDKKQSQFGKTKTTNSNESDNCGTKSSDSESTETDNERNSYQSSSDNDADYDKENNDDINEARDRNQGNMLPRGSRHSKRLAGIPGHTVPESLDIDAKKKLRQRASENTDAESLVAMDSEDERSHLETS